MKEPALTPFRHITVAFLVVFGIFLLMMLWAYAKVCSVPVLGAE